MREGQPQPSPEKALPFTSEDKAWFEKGEAQYPEPTTNEEEYPGQREIQAGDVTGQNRTQTARHFAEMQAALDREGTTVPIHKENPAVVDAQLEAVGANLPDEEEKAAA